MKMYKNPQTKTVQLDGEKAILLGTYENSAPSEEQLAPVRNSGNPLQNPIKKMF